MYDYKKFYEARGDVKILTSDGQRFATQSVFGIKIRKESIQETLFMQQWKMALL